MEGGAADVFKHLLKIPAAVTEENLASVLETLWSARHTGLSSSQRRDIQSLLGLKELDLVVVCLRSIIRKSVRQNLSRDGIQKLLPLDLASELQIVLLALLDKYQSDWKEQALRDEQRRVSRVERVNVPPPWPRTVEATTSRSGYPAPAGDSQLPDIKGNLTLLRSMTWTIENPNSGPCERVAVVCLTLQGDTKAAPGELEVKFQLSRDTSEAMLRSVTYINDQLSNSQRSGSKSGERC